MSNEQSVPATAKKPYQAPELRVYGSLVNKTAAGTSNGSDGVHRTA